MEIFCESEAITQPWTGVDGLGQGRSRSTSVWFTFKQGYRRKLLLTVRNVISRQYLQLKTAIEDN